MAHCLAVWDRTPCSEGVHVNLSFKLQPLIKLKLIHRHQTGNLSFLQGPVVYAHHVRTRDRRPTSFSDRQHHILLQASCTIDALAFLEHGHLVQRLFTQAELASDKGGWNQVSRSWVFSSHGQTVEPINGAHQPVFSRLYPWLGLRSSGCCASLAGPAWATRGSWHTEEEGLSHPLPSPGSALCLADSFTLLQDCHRTPRPDLQLGKRRSPSPPPCLDRQEPCRTSQQLWAQQPERLFIQEARRRTSYFPSGSHFDCR